MTVEISNPVKIDRLILRADGKTVELYSGPLRGHVLKLFNAAELVTVGINPADLTPGQVTPCLFLAHWQASEKLNQRGNPHRDLTRLERVIPDKDAPLHEAFANLHRRFNRLEKMLEEALKLLKSGGQNTPFDYFYADGEEAIIQEEKAAFNDFRRANDERVPASRDALREWMRGKKASPPAARPKATGRPLQAQRMN